MAVQLARFLPRSSDPLLRLSLSYSPSMIIKHESFSLAFSCLKSWEAYLFNWFETEKQESNSCFIFLVLNILYFVYALDAECEHRMSMLCGILPLLTLKIYIAINLTQLMQIFPENGRGGFLVWFRFILDARSPIIIFMTWSAGPDFASKSSGFRVHETIVCHMPSGKFPHFLVKFMKATVCLTPPSNLYDPILLW